MSTSSESRDFRECREFSRVGASRRTGVLQEVGREEFRGGTSYVDPRLVVRLWQALEEDAGRRSGSVGWRGAGGYVEEKRGGEGWRRRIREEGGKERKGAR
ncbi:hypothetical protein HYQ46_009579 [Verticillium longisporum]|nr:hypothetical protein HYQ46_009579 [Verticillium longisporum]